MKMKKYIILPVILLLMLSGCEDYKQRYYFMENRIEFQDAVINPNNAGTSGGISTFPVIPGDINGDAGGIVRLQVNMTGEQAHAPYDRILDFEVIAVRTTAREGMEYNLPHGTSFVIPANSSFGFIEIEILPGGSGRRLLALELKPTEDIKVMDRYHRIGFRILYQLSPPDPDYVQQINDITYFRRITTGAQSSVELGGYMDLITGDVYTRLGAAPVQNKIDLVYLRGSSTGINLLTPSDYAFTSWSTESAILNDWAVRNHGTLVRWASPTPDEEARFESAQSLNDLLENFFYAQATARDRSDYNANYGPSSRGRDGDAGDIFLFYSADRKVVAMIKVLDWENTTSGLANFAIKSGQIPDDMVKKPVTLAPQSSTVVGGAVDLLTGRVYFRDPANIDPAALPVHEQIDMIFVLSTSTNLSLFTPPALGTGFGNYSYLQDPTHWAYWPTRNAGTLVRMPNATPAEIDMFENAQTAADLQAIFDYAEAQAPGRDYSGANPASNSPVAYADNYYGPGTAVRGIWPGDAVQLIAFRSADRGVVSVIKVVNVFVSNTSAVGNSNSRITTEVKSAQL